MSPERRLAAFFITFFLASGCNGPAYYRPACAKLTASLRTVCSASQEILEESQSAYEEQLLICYGLDNPGQLKSSHMPKAVGSVVERPEGFGISATNLKLRRELFDTVEETCGLLDKLAGADYADEAEQELNAIAARLGQIGKNVSGSDGKIEPIAQVFSAVVSNALKFHQESAIREALQGLCQEKGALDQLDDLLLKDVHENFGAKLLLFKNKTRVAWVDFLQAGAAEAQPDLAARVEVLKHCLKLQRQLIVKGKLLDDYKAVLDQMDGARKAALKASESSDFLAVLTALDGLFARAVELKLSLQNSEAEE